MLFFEEKILYKKLGLNSIEQVFGKFNYFPEEVLSNNQWTPYGQIHLMEILISAI